MPTTRDQLIARAQMHLPPKRAELAIPGRVDDMEDTLILACRMLAEKAMEDDGIRRWLTKSFTLTALSSTGKLALTDSSLATVLIKSIHEGSLIVAGYTDPCDYYADNTDMVQGAVHPDVPRFNVSNGYLNVYTTNTAKPVASKVCTLSNVVFIPFVGQTTPSDTTLPVELEEDLVMLMVAAQQARLGAGAPQSGG